MTSGARGDAITIRGIVRTGSEYRMPQGYSRALQSVYQSGIDQKSIEAPGFRAILAGIEHALAAQHDALLLLERRVERNAGGFLNYDRNISRIECFQRRR